MQNGRNSLQPRNPNDPLASTTTNESKNVARINDSLNRRKFTTTKDDTDERLRQ